MLPHNRSVLKFLNEMYYEVWASGNYAEIILGILRLLGILELFQGIIVTVFWKTDHLDTTTDIHLLPVRDRHTHALSRNTKH